MTAATGIHHVTAIASDPQRNLDFYVGVLGLRFIKRTVNFDDPGSYHFYFGDERGSPGTLLTFFPWPGAQRGRIGAGYSSATVYAAPSDSLGFWEHRLRSAQASDIHTEPRFDSHALCFSDPDGLPLEILESPSAPAERAWRNGGIDAAYALRGFAGVTLQVDGYEHTARVLTDLLGLHADAHADNRFRYRFAGESAQHVDVLCTPDARRGALAAGVTHHVAWRAASEADQVALQRGAAGRGLNVTPVVDRSYFRSIYFREPGHVLFEVATDAPGFTTDEPLESLGQRLCLPPRYEPIRAQIEAALPRINPPATAQAP